MATEATSYKIIMNMIFLRIYIYIIFIFKNMKTNFKTKNSIEENVDYSDKKNNLEEEREFNQNEFEDFVSKSGAKGSFMIFRSKNKKDELGIDQL